MKLDLLKAKLKAAKAERIIRRRQYNAAERGYIDEVIMPHGTRRRLCRALDMLADKQSEQPWKKHDNMPL